MTDTATHTATHTDVFSTDRDRPEATIARHRDLGRIHAAKRALGWDEDTYRNVLNAVAGDRYARFLDAPARRAAIAFLERTVREQIGDPGPQPIPRDTPGEAPAPEPAAPTDDDILSDPNLRDLFA